MDICEIEKLFWKKYHENKDVYLSGFEKRKCEIKFNKEDLNMRICLKSIRKDELFEKFFEYAKPKQQIMTSKEIIDVDKEYFHLIFNEYFDSFLIYLNTSSENILLESIFILFKYELTKRFAKNRSILYLSFL